MNNGRTILRGRWFHLLTEKDHSNLLDGGRVRKGSWSGPGRYLLLTYYQRCPRNCCYDYVIEILSAKEVIEEVKDMMKDLAYMMKEAKRCPT